jgi:hypothetical protein
MNSAAIFWDASLTLDPEDGGRTFLCNTGEHLPDYVASQKIVLFKFHVAQNDTGQAS